jgi:adenylate cyclase
VAEIELFSEEEKFIKPSWLGIEVTGDKKYSNSMLSRMPFKKW